jgi:hypothetical protein
MMTTIRIWLCNCAVVVMNYYSCEVVWDTKNTFSCVANIPQLLILVMTSCHRTIEKSVTVYFCFDKSQNHRIVIILDCCCSFRCGFLRNGNGET